MGLRGFLLLTAIAAVVEVVAVKYWINSTGFDCYPRCDTSQVVSGWTAAIVPLLIIALLIVWVGRWLLLRSGRDPKGGFSSL